MRLSSIPTVLAVTLAVWFSPHNGAWAADDALQTVFQRMDQASRTFKSLKADMKKTKHTDFVHEDDTDTGMILVKVPKPHDFHVLIDFVQPDPKKVSLTGTKLEIFYPKTNTVDQYDLGKSHKAQVEQFVLLGFGSNPAELQRAYTVTLGGPATVEGRKTTRIVLVPKAEDLRATFPKFELWIDDQYGVSIQQKAYETGEKDYSLAIYSNVMINPDIADSQLKLTVPKDAKRSKPQK